MLRPFCTVKCYSQDKKIHHRCGAICGIGKSIRWLSGFCVSALCPFSQPTSPTTPNKPLAPLDWASTVTTKPDPSVVNKHIRKVVDVSI